MTKTFEELLDEAIAVAREHGVGIDSIATALEAKLISLRQPAVAEALRRIRTEVYGLEG